MGGYEIRKRLVNLPMSWLLYPLVLPGFGIGFLLHIPTC